MVPEINLEDIAKYVENIAVYNDGNILLYPCGSDKFKKICAAWQGMLICAHQMPAYGVSLNAETLQAVKRGRWVEFDFGQTYCSNGMPFERLLVNVEKEYQGFNVVRYNAENGYDGRCFYFDLNGKDMSDFYNCVYN